uniref:DNA-3-methyladenine glycosylase I n=1 Tax=Aplanochytrium stocchinoi TaxID=215587 RepID=A0A7S3PQV3_9STRA|mmetsp:Transcript_10998/g.12574  ORF Transcript_10998/g.12574 Transcript_10998/m.12574 type:complete len:221 (+) Transcript_10998:247-909(+)|eukprot:CAMPEP_0204824806 /NCGR_PEP_ID=MMETSP1346-20131115/2779_1 /ASSEMBLY_ACC=CAM_ASM_000771 /TAXON_ID=215587 /ORGANISM="Aplanochytrium stocchinoi, Strain GSBS06" /LENGTH=220 /DNA_ID=CAMNT_0051952143 /DNA_START=264 /DNA_END=926 /DNA_ORIENTATION=+
MVKKRRQKTEAVPSKKRVKTEESVGEKLFTSKVNDVKRCKWCESHELYIEYHDNEWGRPVYDDDKLFEMISLEGAQAGLNWLTILKKRNGYRDVFKKFKVCIVAKFTERDIERALVNPNVIRHKGKLNSVVHNSRLILELQRDPKYGSFSNFVWSYAPTERRFDSHCQGNSPEAQCMSKDLKKRGFKFVGPTTCYAFMQACGIVNDHAPHCFLFEKKHSK